eukprot:scaffold122038_cov64-Phaeocystis_antarctica.AAC.7
MCPSGHISRIDLGRTELPPRRTPRSVAQRHHAVIRCAASAAAAAGSAAATTAASAGRFVPEGAKRGCVPCVPLR